MKESIKIIDNEISKSMFQLVGVLQIIINAYESGDTPDERDVNKRRDLERTINHLIAAKNLLEGETTQEKLP